jgi:hypothetical protein
VLDDGEDYAVIETIKGRNKERKRKRDEDALREYLE